jgi:hypothetical protein
MSLVINCMARKYFIIREHGKFATIITLLLFSQLAVGQALEPRRWSHLPVGVNFVGVGYLYSEADILLDPALQLEDVSADIHTAVLSYVRALDVFGKSGRIDIVVPYTVGRWQGLQEGVPASTRRSGFNDPKVRFAVNLLGSPAQNMAEFKQFKVDTIVGAALEVTVPIGEYYQEKLINLGTNRWSFRPQLGIVHNRNKWTAELTTSAWIYTDNDDFYKDTTRKQDPLYAVQGHLIYTFRPGLWTSLSAAYGGGARSTIDGVEKDDQIGKSIVALSLGIPINPRNGLKFAYLHSKTNKDTGDDYNRFLLAYSMMWGGRK